MSDITYEQAIEATEHKNFYVKTTTIDGYRISMFNYRIAKYEDFVNSDVNLLEMRGLTFVHEEHRDGPDTHHRYLMLHKFFTLGQTPTTRPENLTDPITHVYDKIDGSMIRFILLPNGKIVAKTKMSFESPQAIAATEMLHADKKLATIVTHSIANGIAIIFEFTADTNQIVLEYKEPTLTILQARDEATGEYLDISQYADYPHRADPHPDLPTLQYLMELSETLTRVEGWVVRFGNHFVKVKTNWYIEAHRIATGNQPHNIAVMVINGVFDDYSQTINVNHPMYEIAQKINTELTAYMLEQFATAVAIAKTITPETRKEFAIANNKHPMFKIIMIIVHRRDVEYALAVYKNGLSRKIGSKESWKAFASKHLS